MWHDDSSSKKYYLLLGYCLATAHTTDVLATAEVRVQQATGKCGASYVRQKQIIVDFIQRVDIICMYFARDMQHVMHARLMFVVPALDSNCFRCV